MRLKSPSNQWKEMDDGSLLLVHHDTHCDADVLIIPVEIRKPMASSRVMLAMRNKETGEMAYYADSDSSFLKPRQLALSTALQNGVRYRLNPSWLLRVGIDYYPDRDPFVREWEREINRFGRHHQ